MLRRDELTTCLAELPLFQFEFIKTEELTFSDRIRFICENECPMYGTTWACPPAVGTVAACKAKCLSYPDALLITSVAEVSDISDMEQTLETRGPHEALTHQVAQKMRQCGASDLYVLSTEACALCENCTYPHGPCRHPDRMFPCVESQGIVVTDVAERHGIEFIMGNLVVWFSLLLYR